MKGRVEWCSHCSHCMPNAHRFRVYTCSYMCVPLYVCMHVQARNSTVSSNVITRSRPSQSKTQFFSPSPASALVRQVQHRIPHIFTHFGKGQEGRGNQGKRVRGVVTTYMRKEVGDAGSVLCVAGLDVPRVRSIVRRWSLSHHLHSQEEGKGTRGERGWERTSEDVT